jgi:hypothetical protein
LISAILGPECIRATRLGAYACLGAYGQRYFLRCVGGNTTNGIYLYRIVNIWNGTLTFRDAKIDFHAHSILVENNGTLEAGFDTPVAGPITIWLYGAKGDGIPSIHCQSSETCGVPGDLWRSNPNAAELHRTEHPAMISHLRQ